MNLGIELISRTVGTWMRLFVEVDVSEADDEKRFIEEDDCEEGSLMLSERDE